jgi:hypothetical protein
VSQGHRLALIGGGGGGQRHGNGKVGCWSSRWRSRAHAVGRSERLEMSAEGLVIMDPTARCRASRCVFLVPLMRESKSEVDVVPLWATWRPQRGAVNMPVARVRLWW